MWSVLIYEGTGPYAEKSDPVEIWTGLSKRRAFLLGYWYVFKWVFPNLALYRGGRWVKIVKSKGDQLTPDPQPEDPSSGIGLKLARRIKSSYVHLVGQIEYVYFGGDSNITETQRVICSKSQSDDRACFVLWDLMKEAGYHVTLQDSATGDSEPFKASTWQACKAEMTSALGSSRIEALVKLFVMVMPVVNPSVNYINVDGRKLSP